MKVQTENPKMQAFIAGTELARRVPCAQGGLAGRLRRRDIQPDAIVVRVGASSILLFDVDRVPELLLQLSAPRSIVP